MNVLEAQISKSIQGHEVMALMQAQEQPLTEAALKQLLQDTFGNDVSYYTCSKEGMSADELIAFLRSKKKFIESDAGWQMDSRRICNH